MILVAKRCLSTRNKKEEIEPPRRQERQAKREKKAKRHGEYQPRLVLPVPFYLFWLPSSACQRRARRSASQPAWEVQVKEKSLRKRAAISPTLRDVEARSARWLVLSLDGTYPRPMQTGCLVKRVHELPFLPDTGRPTGALPRLWEGSAGRAVAFLGRCALRARRSSALVRRQPGRLSPAVPGPQRLEMGADPRTHRSFPRSPRGASPLGGAVSYPPSTASIASGISQAAAKDMTLCCSRCATRCPPSGKGSGRDADNGCGREGCAVKARSRASQPCVPKQSLGTRGSCDRACASGVWAREQLRHEEKESPTMTPRDRGAADVSAFLDR